MRNVARRVCGERTEKRWPIGAPHRREQGEREGGDQRGASGDCGEAGEAGNKGRWWGKSGSWWRWGKGGRDYGEEGKTVKGNGVKGKGKGWWGTGNGKGKNAGRWRKCGARFNGKGNGLGLRYIRV